ncbi:hypothetical protein ABK040_012905 [Willaertia magna]
MSELSTEDILRIVRHFLLSSPPGQFEDVLHDVRELVSNDDLINTGAYDIFRTYNIEQLIPVEVPEKNYKVILSKYNEMEQSVYLDPAGDELLEVDHVKGVVKSANPNPNPIDSELKQKRDQLEKAVQKYIEEHYLSGGIANVFPALKDDQKGELIVCITASKFNEKNFWSGRWRSVYRVSLQEEGKAKVSGIMKVNVHYYENGNVQLNTSREHGETVDSGDQWAENVVKVLRKAEGNFQTQIDTACNNLNDTFKSLRRPLPLTKTLFDFASSQHKLAKEFGNQ